MDLKFKGKKEKGWKCGEYTIKHAFRYSPDKNVTDRVSAIGPDIYHCYYKDIYIAQSTILSEAKEFCDEHYLSSIIKNKID